MRALALPLIVMFAFPSFGLEPIRKAVGLVRIQKYTFTDADGGMYVKSEVCTKTTQFMIYKATSPGAAYPINPSTYYSVQCDSTIAGQPVQVLVGGLLVDVRSVPPSAPESSKYVDLSLWVDPDSEATDKLASNFTVEVDPSNKQIVTSLMPLVQVTCTPDQNDEFKCTTNTPEYFKADVRLYDQ